MPPPAPSRLRQTCGRVWRWIRAVFWTSLVVIALLLTCLHLVGVPNPIKHQLESALRARGLDLQLGRVRLRGLRTFVVENIVLSQSQTNLPPQRISRADFILDPGALWRLKFELAALEIHPSQLLLPSANSPADPLVVEAFAASFQFPPEDEWQIEQLSGKIGGVELHITAQIQHPRAFRKHEASAPGREAATEWRDQLREIAGQLNRIHAASPALLQIHVDADGEQPGRLKAHLLGDITALKTPWGDCEQLQIHGTVSPSTKVNALNATWRVRSKSGRGRWGELDELNLNARFSASVTNLQLIAADWRLHVQTVQTSFGSATGLKITGTTQAASGRQAPVLNSDLEVTADDVRAASVRMVPFQLTARLAHPSANPVAVRGSWRSLSQRVETPWGQSERFTINGRIAPSLDSNAEFGSDLHLWRVLAPFHLDWDCQVAAVTSPRMNLDALALSGRWRPPNVTVPELTATLYGGRLQGSAELNVLNRELRAQSAFDFDAHKLAPLLTTNAQRWLRQFTWETPPSVQAQARLFLPAWTNRHPAWRKEVLPGIELEGSFEGGKSTFRNIPIQSARSHFTLTNLVWRLPDLTITRPEGNAVLDYEWHMFQQDYFWTIHCHIDPTALGPMLAPPHGRILKDFQFREAPHVKGQISGRWHRPELTTFHGQIAATDFIFRGEPCSALQTSVEFTNLFLVLRETVVRSEGQQATASGLGYDPAAHHLYVTNATGNIDAHRIVKLIGPRTQAALDPYRFADPPTIVLNGRLPTHPDAQADAHFNIRGQSFKYWKFRAPEVSGDAYWRGDTLSISNLQASFYNGKLNWEGQFDFTARDGADFMFRGNVIQADLSSLAADFTGKTNRLDGSLNSQFTIASANSKAPDSWTGFGAVQVRDGFLWSVPVFGAFSPLLNWFAPGLGNSRVNAASANFAIDAGRVTTSDLELRSPAVRLQYAGAVDLEGNVKARVQAEPLRDAWGVGPLVSMALWPITKLFEAKVSGTINEPKSELLFVPKVLSWPFHPLRSMLQILEDQQTEPLKR